MQTPVCSCDQENGVLAALWQDTILETLKIMNLKETINEVESFHAKQYRQQITFKTPLNDRPRFVKTFLSSFALVRGSATIELVVFEPKNLLELLALHSLSHKSIASKFFMHLTIEATGQEEIRSLLEAALGDWVDLTFVANPPAFAVFADHNEYITFFSDDNADLSDLTSALVNGGFAPVLDFTREF